jgi:hypothetical protein
MCIHRDSVWCTRFVPVYTPRHRLSRNRQCFCTQMLPMCIHRDSVWCNRIGACVYTETPLQSTHTMFVHPDAVYVHTPRQRLMQHIGACVYTETPSESTQSVLVHQDAVYVYTPIQRLLHHICAGVYTQTPSESTQTMLVHQMLSRCIHRDNVSCMKLVPVYTPIQRMSRTGNCLCTQMLSRCIHRDSGWVQCAETHSESTHAMFVHTDAV